ncbi:MAG: glycoside hydrolase family 42, partial [Chloroflexales bacterium]|nr:glycoside hydrolase family 42 [Chloroflexales bacterium]
HSEVAALDPKQMTTIGMAFAKSYFEPAAADLHIARLVDFYSFHYYDNDPYDSGRYAAHWYYGAGFPHDLARAIDELAALPDDKPIVITEIGFPTGEQALRGATELRRDLRLALQTSRERGASGIMLWPFQRDSAGVAGDLFRGRQ